MNLNDLIFPTDIYTHTHILCMVKNILFCSLYAILFINPFDRTMLKTILINEK